MSERELLESIQQGDEEKVAGLLAVQPELAAARDANGVSLLMLALYHRRPAIAERIAAHRGEAALDLHEAAALGREELVRRALEHDAGGLEARSADGFTPLHYAAFFGRPRVARLLVERGAQVSAVAENAMKVQPLHSAAAIGNIEICGLLLEAGADASARQQVGYTSLMTAAHRGNVELVRLLLAHGADAGAVAEDGKSARSLAEEEGHTEVLALLGQ